MYQAASDLRNCLSEAMPSSCNSDPSAIIATRSSSRCNTAPSVLLRLYALQPILLCTHPHSNSNVLARRATAGLEEDVKTCQDSTVSEVLISHPKLARKKPPAWAPEACCPRSKVSRRGSRQPSARCRGAAGSVPRSLGVNRGSGCGESN